MRGTLINDAADKINNFGLRSTIFHPTDSTEKKLLFFYTHGTPLVSGQQAVNVLTMQNAYMQRQAL